MIDVKYFKCYANPLYIFFELLTLLQHTFFFSGIDMSSNYFALKPMFNTNRLLVIPKILYHVTISRVSVSVVFFIQEDFRHVLPPCPLVAYHISTTSYIFITVQGFPHYQTRNPRSI